jgi:hypothetical protein
VQHIHKPVGNEVADLAIALPRSVHRKQGRAERYLPESLLTRSIRQLQRTAFGP